MAKTDLTWRERQIVQLRSEGLTLATIAKIYKVSPERVRQIDLKARRKTKGA